MMSQSNSRFVNADNPDDMVQMVNIGQNNRDQNGIVEESPNSHNSSALPAAY